MNKLILLLALGILIIIPNTNAELILMDDFEDNDFLEWDTSEAIISSSPTVFDGSNYAYVNDSFGIPKRLNASIIMSENETFNISFVYRTGAGVIDNYVYIKDTDGNNITYIWYDGTFNEYYFVNSSENTFATITNAKTIFRELYLYYNNNTIYAYNNGTHLGNATTEILSGFVGELSYVRPNGGETQIIDRVEVYTWSLPKLNISFYNEQNNTLITDNISITLYNQFDEVSEYTSTSGFLYLENLTEANYSVELRSSNFSYRTYNVSLFNNIFGSITNLSTYLVPSSSPEVVFSFKDKDTGNIIEGVVLTVQTLINTEWVVIEALTSDITGKTGFNYIEDEPYRFIASASGYDTKIFTLNPIIFNTYTVNMEKSVTQEHENDYSGISIVLTPNKYYNNATNNVTFTIISPYGELVDYGFNLSLGAGVVSFSGNDANGGTLNYSSVINNAELTDRVIIKYHYELSNGVYKEYTKVYSIIGAYNENTFLYNLGNNYGMGIFERMLIVTLIIIAVGGLIIYYAGAIAGGVMSALIMAFFVFTDFIPFWSIAISVVMLFIIVGWRSSL